MSGVEHPEAAAPRPVLVARVSHREGQLEAFNAWYAEHVAEVLAVPGIRGVQRYRLSAHQAPGARPPTHEWLAVYEIDGDVAAVMAELVRRRADGEWSPRRGVVEETIGMWAFEPVAPDGGPPGSSRRTANRRRAG